MWHGHILHVKWCQKLHSLPKLSLLPSAQNCRHTLLGLGSFSPPRRPLRLQPCYPPRWRCRGLSRPDTQCSPGLCHQCEGKGTEHPPLLDHLPPPLVHMQLIFPSHILLSACLVSPSMTMPSFGQVLTCVCWQGEGRVSTPKWLTLTSPVSTPRGWCLQGVSLQWVSEDRDHSICSQFLSCSPPVFHGILWP